MASLFFTSIIILFAGAVAAIALWHKPALARLAGYGAACIGSLAAAGYAVSLLLTGATAQYSFLTIASYPVFSFSIDALGAFFILLISVAGTAVSVYAFSYAEHYEGKYNIGRLGSLYNLFICAMLLVVASANVVAFLVFWELMSILSYFLVTYEHKKESALRAGLLYAVMTHLGTIFLTIAFFIFFRETGSFQFADFRALADHIPQAVQNLIFVLVVIGFGSKAGIVPLHIWLPEAHPAAPSHVSALMSGAMIKIAVYGIVRIAFDIFGVTALWWGGMIVAIGVLSAILGVLYALMENDLKRLLAYSSIENIGIIFIGLGSSMILAASGHPVIAGAALLASLFHAFNHSIFKSLLFMGVGAIQKATGTKDMEKLGGLVKAMPMTAIMFLIGSLSIAALPPMNGFASEWLIFQSLLSVMIHAESVAMQVAIGISVAFLALVSALALVVSIKAFGISFLALPRSAEAADAKESKKTMRVGMFGLAVACIALGVFPALATAIIHPVVAQLHLGSLAAQATSFVFPLNNTASHIAPLWGTVFFVGVVVVMSIVALVFWGRHRKRKAPTWACGRLVEPYMEYTGSGLAMPFKMVFSGFYRPTHNIERETLEGATYQISSVRYEESIVHLLEQYVYGPGARITVVAGDIVKRLQTGNLNMYLFYIFATLIALLYFFA